MRSARAARRSFDLPSAELADINRWLIAKSRLSAAVALGFVYVLALAGVELPLGLLTGLALVAMVMSLPFQRWLHSGRALGLLIYAQFAFDVVAHDDRAHQGAGRPPRSATTRRVA